MTSASDFFRRAGKAAAARAVKDVRVSNKRPATVQSTTENLGGDSFGRLTARVRIDGTTRDVQASVNINQPLVPGDRVFVEFNPPHQYLITAFIPVGNRPKCYVLAIPFVEGENLNVDQIQLDSSDVDIVNCGFVLDPTPMLQITAPITAVYQLSLLLLTRADPGPIAVDDTVGAFITHNATQINYGFFQVSADLTAGWDDLVVHNPAIFFPAQAGDQFGVTGFVDPPGLDYVLSGGVFCLTTTCCEPELESVTTTTETAK